MLLQSVYIQFVSVAAWSLNSNAHPWLGEIQTCYILFSSAGVSHYTSSQSWLCPHPWHMHTYIHVYMYYVYAE